MPHPSTLAIRFSAEVAGAENSTTFAEAAGPPKIGEPPLGELEAIGEGHVFPLERAMSEAFNPMLFYPLPE